MFLRFVSQLKNIQDLIIVRTIRYEGDPNLEGRGFGPEFSLIEKKYRH